MSPGSVRTHVLGLLLVQFGAAVAQVSEHSSTGRRQQFQVQAIHLVAEQRIRFGTHRFELAERLTSFDRNVRVQLPRKKTAFPRQIFELFVDTGQPVAHLLSVETYNVNKFSRPIQRSRRTDTDLQTLGPIRLGTAVASSGSDWSTTRAGQ